MLPRASELTFKSFLPFTISLLFAFSIPLLIGWIEAMPFSDIHGFKGDREIYDASVGAAGAGFVLLYAARRVLHPRALQWATEVGDRLLEVAQPTEAGLNWALMSDMPFPWNPANFAHGAAGVGTLMAMLYEATGDLRFLDAAQGAAAHLMHIAHAAGDGHLVHHHDGDGKQALLERRRFVRRLSQWPT